MPPWTMSRYDPDGVEMRGHFSRFHVGGNGAVHGGVLPLLFDHVFGMVVHAAGRPISRTGFLHVDYRKITPIDTPLMVRGHVAATEGRKAFVRGELLDGEHPVGRGQRPDDPVAARPAVTPHLSLSTVTTPQYDTTQQRSDTDRPTVMLLGAGEFSRELSTALRRLGAHVIRCRTARTERTSRPTQSLVVDLTNADELGAAIKRPRPHFVVDRLRRGCR